MLIKPAAKELRHSGLSGQTQQAISAGGFNEQATMHQELVMIKRHVVRMMMVLAALGVLTACAVELQNQQPAKALAQANKAPGSAYIGWRVFQDKCARCHGPAATGGAHAPDLLPRVATMGQRRFVNLVLTRYDWDVPATEARSEGAMREALIDQIVQREKGAVSMPAWQGEPQVQAHIIDLFTYLSARAQGSLGSGRPAP
jgi:mono/diheme cytochrome c family protein